MNLNIRLLLLYLFIFTSCMVMGQSSNTDTKISYQQYTDQEIMAANLDSLSKYVKDQYYQKNYDITIGLGTRVITEAERIDSLNIAVELASFVGNAFLKSGDSITAKKVLLENVARAEILENDKNLLTTKIDLANYYAVREDSKQAIKIFLESIEVANSLRDTTSLFILHNNISEISLEQKNLQLATFHVAKTLQIAEDLKLAEAPESPYYYPAAISLSGRLNYLKGDAESSIRDLKQAAQLAEDVNFDEILIQIYDYLAKAEILNKNFEGAFYAKEKYNQYQDKKYETDKIQAIETVTAQYKLDQYQQELKEQAFQATIDQAQAKRETTILWVIIAAVILLIFLFFVIRSNVRRRRLLTVLRVKNKQYLSAKEESEQLSRAKSILFSNITHELRTPMYGIIGLSNGLFNNKKFESERESLRSLKFSADYLLSLINNILQFNKMDNMVSSNEEEYWKAEKFDLRKLVENIVESAQFLNTDHPNRYEIDIDEKLPELLIGDEMKLSQILINLISNATKFTENGLIQIILLEKERNATEIEISFSIRDNGIGISGDKQKLIFDEFAQMGEGEQFMGTGLGLPIVKKLLDLQKVPIKLESRRGVGTTIGFDLSFEIPTQPQSGSGKSEISKYELKGFHILVVDDNRINQIVTKNTVERYGASCDIVGGGKEAIKNVKGCAYDLILMDINMPVMNGFEATVAIRELAPTLPIVALTAVEKEKVVGDNAFHLMNDIVIKPFSDTDFIDLLSETIRNHKQIAAQ